MTAGFAFIAYPAEYLFGCNDFIVNKSGTIYEKDLGPNTTKLAEAMKPLTRIPPGTRWTKNTRSKGQPAATAGITKRPFQTFLVDNDHAV